MTIIKFIKETKDSMMHEVRREWAKKGKFAKRRRVRQKAKSNTVDTERFKSRQD